VNRTSRDGDDRARGNRHTVGKCERAQHETVRGNWEEVESGSVSRNSRGGIRRTDGKTIKPLGLPEEAVYLMHLVHPNFRPAFFVNHSIDLFPEGFQIFGIGKEAVQKLRGSLWVDNDYGYVIDGDGHLPKPSYVYLQNWLRAIAGQSLQWTSPLPWRQS
jgi:hypothetical protein